MDLKKLKSVYWQSVEIKNQRNRLFELCLKIKYEKSDTLAQEIENQRQIIEQSMINVQHDINNSEKEINEIDDTVARQILRKRYLEFKTFECIGREMHYDESSIRRKHREIIKNLPKNTAFYDL